MHPLGCCMIFEKLFRVQKRAVPAEDLDQVRIKWRQLEKGRGIAHRGAIRWCVMC
jgi:hypothetical protein